MKAPDEIGTNAAEHAEASDEAADIAPAQTRVPTLIRQFDGGPVRHIGPAVREAADDHRSSPTSPGAKSSGSASNGTVGTSTAILRVRGTVPPISTESSKRLVGQDRASARARDQFYTKHHVAAICLALVELVLVTDEYLMLEPSAGEGAFLELLPDGSIGVDIEPKRDGILIADLLEVEIESERKILAIGNPPFGRQASMARRFFNHLARHPKVEVIAFILPRSFRKTSVQRQLDLSFHLLCEWEVPADAFLFQGKPYDVPAVFMIWVRRAERRAVAVAETDHPDFEFVTREAAQRAAELLASEGGDAASPFAIQRVGEAAGRVHRDLTKSGSSHLFVLPKVGGVEATMRRLQPHLHRISRDVAGNPSIAKSEIVSAYKALVKNGPGQSVPRCRRLLSDHQRHRRAVDRHRAGGAGRARGRGVERGGDRPPFKLRRVPRDDRRCRVPGQGGPAPPRRAGRLATAGDEARAAARRGRMGAPELRSGVVETARHRTAFLEAGPLDGPADDFRPRPAGAGPD